MMSDYEEDMEVDGPVASNAITFSSDNTNAKGKRSAANLPVEAEDSLPWSDSPLQACFIHLTDSGWKSIAQIH